MNHTDIMTTTGTGIATVVIPISVITPNSRIATNVTNRVARNVCLAIAITRMFAHIPTGRHSIGLRVILPILFSWD